MTDENRAHFEEDIEGEDLEAMESWGDDLLDTVFVRHEPRTVGEIAKRIKKGRYKLDPDLLEEFMWPVKKQARLIESCLMRIPLPVFYVAEDSDGRIIVIDGLQRLSTLERYLRDEFPLSDIGKSDPENAATNKCFSQLPIHLQERIEDTQLSLYILDSKAPERARLGIFERVNSGARFSRQQMRHCLHSGPATRWLEEASKLREFVRASGGAVNVKTMRDRELINRFCAFYLLGHEAYTGDMDGFMADALKKMNKMSTKHLAQMLDLFQASMALCAKTFGKHAFRKSAVNNINVADDELSPLNIALFDCLSVALAKSLENADRQSPKKIRERLIALLSYDKFDTSISASTNSRASVSTRHDFLERGILAPNKEDIRVEIYRDMARDLISDSELADWENEFADACKGLNRLIDAGNDFIDIELKFSNMLSSSPLEAISSQLFQNMRKHAEKSQEIMLP